MGALRFKGTPLGTAPTGTSQNGVALYKRLYVAPHIVGVWLVGFGANVKRRDCLMPFAFYHPLDLIGSFLASVKVEAGDWERDIYFHKSCSLFLSLFHSPTYAINGIEHVGVEAANSLAVE